MIILSNCCLSCALQAVFGVLIYLNVFFLPGWIFFFFKFYLVNFLAALGVCCCVQTFCRFKERGLLFVWASHCSGFSCCGVQALGCSGLQ